MEFDAVSPPVVAHTSARLEAERLASSWFASPIIDWFDYDIWLYLMTTGIDFNSAYRYVLYSCRLLVLP